ncbi:hypothetical protein C882_1431 [Caenispirillum salinarum AK4]|uniref:Polymerase nucleotidyl transferase domain-containing protein n=1 Tax=Caenispirillum salinarum AK4 TaxID=1238182 RepID=K9GNR1_9PROT|nr:nucleotidyltransferase domain-containing protein [Caenispirillum salinarum]EKV27585.1 hypothetical protein C882_1431 [Caenispirillum salinarum AK4]
MRLSDYEVRAILEASREAFGDDAVVRLFGSRVDDTARGGDIDLHVTIPDREGWAMKRAKFLAGMWMRMGERKIDVVVHLPDEPDRPVDKVAQRDGVVLH